MVKTVIKFEVIQFRKLLSNVYDHACPSLIMSFHHKFHSHPLPRGKILVIMGNCEIKKTCLRFRYHGNN